MRRDVRGIGSLLVWVIAGALTWLSAGTAHADEPVAEFRLGERDTPHVGVPFLLDMVIEGLDEQPTPTTPKLEIANAQVAFVAAEPNIQRGIQIVNGRRSDFSKVTWVMRWSVEPRKEGRMHIPSLTATQGSKHATARAGEADVDTIPVTDAMKLSLALPERPIFVGETVPVTLTWLFKSNPSDDPKWSIPLMALDAFTVSGPPATASRKLLTFQAGSKELKLPYEVDQIDQGGAKTNRLVTTFFLAPKQPGKLDVPASSVVAALQTGRADFFGNAPSRLYRAVDVTRVLEVKPLPQTDRPSTFAGAVGEQFSIDVTTSRSVVQLGEPVELAIRIKSNQRLDTLALGRLDGEGGLPKDRFVVPSEPATGELSDDGKTKTFKVTAQVTGPATSVPAIAFAYFDPAKGTYQTIRSEPIALSVAGGSVVGASDVVAVRPKAGAKPAQGDALEIENLAVNAQLALSSAGQEDDRPISGVALWLLVGVLYAVPLGLLAARRWQLRTQGQREDAAEVRAARRKVEELLDRAGPSRRARSPGRWPPRCASSRGCSAARSMEPRPHPGALPAGGRPRPSMMAACSPSSRPRASPRAPRRSRCRPICAPMRRACCGAGATRRAARARRGSPATWPCSPCWCSARTRTPRRTTARSPRAARRTRRRCS